MVSGAEAKVMPPMGARLTAAEIDLLKAGSIKGVAWSAAQAAGPLVVPEDPTARAAGGARQGLAARNAIDYFILAKLDAENIKPSPEASKSTLIRRLSLDLTGLPPTPQEVAAFLADTRTDAYERLVDRLLDSPHYGEKWARYWLDLARYADSDGYEKDRSRPWAWRYRQWVIDALQSRLPFDQFTIEQLAGDLLPNRTIDNLVATGFNRNTLTNREGGTDPEQFRDEQVLDRTATLGTVWMGLTVGCAQCHNHKYDPIAQKEFYQLSAFFNTQEEVNIPAPMAGEVGPYLAARPQYDASAARAARGVQDPREPGGVGREAALRGAASGRARRLDLRLRRVHPHRGQRAQGAVPGPGAPQRNAGRTRCTDVFLGSCGNLFPEATLRRPEARRNCGPS